MGAVEIRGLTRRFSDVLAVDALDLTVQGPGVFGFLGANGAGKTTTLRMLVGLIHPSAGEVRLFGEPMSLGNDAVRRRIGYLPQDPAFYPWMTAREYLLHTGDLFGLSRRESRSRADELLERTGIAEAARRRVGGFSGGMKQRLGIAQALINRPELVLLDEPASALDPVGRVEVLDLIESLGDDVTVFMSSHILADVERVAEEVAILHRGRLLVHERTRDLKARAVRPAFDVRIRGEVTDLVARLEAAKEISSIDRVEREPDDPEGVHRLRVTTTDPLVTERLLPRAVAESGAGLVSLAPSAPTLEEIFMNLVKHEEREDAA